MHSVTALCDDDIRPAEPIPRRDVIHEGVEKSAGPEGGVVQRRIENRDRGEKRLTDLHLARDTQAGIDPRAESAPIVFALGDQWAREDYVTAAELNLAVNG